MHVNSIKYSISVIDGTIAHPAVKYALFTRYNGFSISKESLITHEQKGG
jgi:hypothetical protein